MLQQQHVACSSIGQQRCVDAESCGGGCVRRQWCAAAEVCDVQQQGRRRVAAAVCDGSGVPSFCLSVVL